MTERVQEYLKRKEWERTELVNNQASPTLRKKRMETIRQCDIHITDGNLFVHNDYVTLLSLYGDKCTKNLVMRAICYTAEALMKRGGIK